MTNSALTLNYKNNTIEMTSIFAKKAGIYGSKEYVNMKNTTICNLKSGRPELTKNQIPLIFYEHYEDFCNKKINISELSKLCGKSRTTIYKYIDLIKAEK